MTVAAVSPLITYLENGTSLGPHAVPFQFLASSDLVVERFDPDGAKTLALLAVDYSVAGGDGSTGTVTMVAARASGWRLRIRRSTARSQPTDYTPGDRFPAESHERALDRVTMIAQEIAAETNEAIGRAVTVPVGSSGVEISAAVAAILEAGTFPPGPPGGNLESIGLKTAQLLPVIPAGVARIRTSGYKVDGLGEGDYAHNLLASPVQGAAYAAANPLTTILAADGRAFPLVSDRVTPWMFGADGPVVHDLLFGHSASAQTLVDNSQAIADFLEYVAAQDRKITPDLSGNWGITDHDSDGIGVVIDQPRFRKQEWIGGNFVALGPMATGMRISLNGGRISGALSFNGLNTSMEYPSAYASRVVDNGIEFFNSYRAHIDEVRVAHVKNQGITDLPTGNNILLTIGFAFFESCGSYTGAPSTTVSGTFSGRTDTGGDAAYNQLSELTGMADTSQFRADSCVYCPTSDTYHFVRSKTASSIKVYPWLPHATTSGTVKSTHGGGARFYNNDSTCVEFGRLDCFNSGVPIWSGGLYGIMVGNYQGQSNSIGIVLGKNPDGTTSTNNATVIKRAHSEGNDLDLLQITPGSTFEIGEVAAWGRDGENLFQRTIALKRRFASGTLGGILAYGDPLQGTIKRRGTTYSTIGLLTDNRVESGETFTNRADGRPYYRTTPSGASAYTVNLEWDTYVLSLFGGAGAIEAYFVGTGTNRAPAGDIIVQPSAEQLADGYTVNGGASVSLTAPLSGRAHLVAMLQPGTKNAQVSW